MIALCDCETPAYKHEKNGQGLADIRDLSASDVANGMATQINLRASICLLFGLASSSFKCSPLSL